MTKEKNLAFHEYYQRHEIDENKHLALDSNESLIGTFKNKRKTKWKVFGNRETDFLQVTNNKLVITYLIKANLKAKNADYRTEIIPASAIEDLSLIEKSNGNHEVEITFFKKHHTNQPMSINLELREESSTAISLIRTIL